MTQAPALPSRQERLVLLEKVGKSLIGMPYKVGTSETPQGSKVF